METAHGYVQVFPGVFVPESNAAKLDAFQTAAVQRAYQISQVNPANGAALAYIQGTNKGNDTCDDFDRTVAQIHDETQQALAFLHHALDNGCLNLPQHAHLVVKLAMDIASPIPQSTPPPRSRLE